MTNKEKVEILLKYFGTKAGNIDLSKIDFGNRNVFNYQQKAKEIYNFEQQAREIYNNGQKANKIYNYYQEANEIYNNGQEANKINNKNQKIKDKYEAMSKEELIARIKELENEDVNE